MSGGVSGIGQSGNIPPELPKIPETNDDPLDAIDVFNHLVETLTSLASETNLGGKR